MMTGTFSPRRTPRLAFGACLLLLWIMPALAAWAAPERLKTVPVGPLRAIKTPHGTKLRPTEAVAERVLVRLAPLVAPQAAQDAVSRVKGRYGKSLGHGMYVVDLPEGADVRGAAAALRAQPGVLNAEPDLITYPAFEPDDPQYGNQYHHPLIQTPAAWDVTRGSADVIIAVIDSGVDTQHPDLSGRIWINPGEIPGNGRDDDGNGYVDDWQGWDFHDQNNNPRPTPDGIGGDVDAAHGTLVAGIAAATGNDGFGTAGVSWGCKVMALQVFPAEGGTAVSTVVEAINYAVSKGAHIINLSIGGGFTDMFTAPINAAYNAGILVVAAAGNDYAPLGDSRTTWKSPVCNDGDDPFTQNHVLGVAATDRYDCVASYSNYDVSSASFVEIAAPGEGIYGPSPYFPNIPGFNTYFGTNSGTSFSCPMVSGLAALLKSRNPSATPTELIAAIRNTGDNLDTANPGYVGMLGGGRLNCARALGVQLPPAKVLGLAAVDTPADNGGSITLSWRKSPDDVGGTEKVITYRVFRKQGASDSYSQIATLPAGTELYVDSAVTDGLEYYYQLRTHDGTLTSDPVEVGPVQSRNDQPPPLITGLSAVDRPDDNGGAIIVQWASYVAPGDFQSFAIYRSSYPFTSTLGMVPIITLTDGSRTSYTDASVSDAVDYYYAVGVRDTAGNETRSVQVVGPVQSFSNGVVSFPAGLHLLSTPTVPADGDPATLFGLPPGSFPFARWSPADGAYLYDAGPRPLAEQLRLQLGHGYWVKFNQPVVVSAEGLSAPAGDFEIQLTPGWHQIGNPFFSAIDFAEATVQYDGATYDLISADGKGILAAFCWTYDSDANTYTLIYPPMGADRRWLQPWQGMWVLAYKPCTLTLARPLGTLAAGAPAMRTAASRPARQDPLSVDWSVALRVQSGSFRDSECFIGAASREVLVPGPPPAQDAPRLTLAAPGPQRDGNYAVSLAPTGQTNIIWRMKIENLRPGQTVELAAPDLSRLPVQAVAVLEDLTTRQTVYLRTVGKYAFTPREGETERSFELSVAPRGTASLVLQAVTAQAAPAGGAAVSFALSSPAACTVSVLNMAGRTVRILEEGKARPAGNNALLWDGRSALGTKVPAGMYLLQVSASGPSGQSVRAMSALRLNR